ncbi:DUF4410 domain-containing protein [Thermodesulfobacteriota bacterium]
MSTQRNKICSLMFVVIFILVMLTGCSTTGSLKINESVEGQTIKGAVVALIVTTPNSNRNEVAIHLREQVVKHLLGACLPKNITEQGDQNADYMIAIKLTTIHKVPYSSRYHCGVLAGSNKITGDVTVIDVKTGQTVRSFSFHGKSAAHPLSGKSDMKDAINKATEEIIKGLS